ncbi:MAG: sortase, partial [Candidatus Doudnabacteria bacterium]|nr:sortase [Candidatus Doudnabacteria bacterium]
TPKPATPKPAPVTPPAQTSAPAVGVGACNVNTNIPGRVEIPSIGVNVPIIWTKDPKNFDTDLKSGVVHYPGTPLPCDVGRSYISGHSSNYSWVKANYNQVFAKLNLLKPGATFKVTVVDMNGKDIRLHYVVTSQKEFAADDQAQFANTAVSEVALSTCWPLNTTKRRLVAFAKLDRIEK